jgi:hypothetical protein
MKYLIEVVEKILVVLLKERLMRKIIASRDLNV